MLIPPVTMAALHLVWIHTACLTLSVPKQWVFVSFLSFRHDGYFHLASLHEILDVLVLQYHLEPKPNILRDLIMLKKLLYF